MSYEWHVEDLMLGTGLRVSEVVPLRWENIDFQARTLTVTHHSVRQKGSAATLVESRKGQSRDFQVTLPRFAVSTLLLRRARVEGEWVFPSRGGFISSGSVGRKLREARGDEFEWVTSHVFRRTVATLISAERDAAAAAAQLGHANEVVTRRHYIQARTHAPDLSDVLELLANNESGLRCVSGACDPASD